MVASLKRTGSIATAVNRSPARDSLLDRVSFKRIFKFVPTGTIGGVTVVRGGGRRRRGLVVCALTSARKLIQESKISRASLLLNFIDSSFKKADRFIGVVVLMRERFD